MAFSATYSTGSQHPVQTGISFHFFSTCNTLQFNQVTTLSLSLHAIWPEVGWETSPPCLLPSGTGLSVSASLAFHFIWSLSWKLLPSPLLLSSCSEMTLLVSVKQLRSGVCMTVRIWRLNPLTFAYKDTCLYWRKWAPVASKTCRITWMCTPSGLSSGIHKGKSKEFI